MAKKKKYRPKRKAHTTSHPRRRRSRMGAASAMKMNANSPVVKLGSIALGYFMGEKILAPVKTAIGDKIDPKIVAGVEGLGGYYLAFKKGKKSMLAVVAGGLLVGDALKTLLKQFGVGSMGPYGRIPALGNRGPYSRVPVLGNRRGVYNPHGGLNGKGTYNPHGSLARVMAGTGMY